jgi:hypothetical protein
MIKRHRADPSPLWPILWLGLVIVAWWIVFVVVWMTVDAH